MGAIAEAIVAYAQPLIDQADGSLDGMNRAMTLAQACWNLALMPEAERDTAIAAMQPTLDLTDEEFAEYRDRLFLPMIRRHYEMFPGLHARSRPTSNTFDVAPSPAKKYPGTDRYSPCPCGSGRKYKFCCGARK
jgi:uncharacterized protein YecA (UPF0149 family)